MKTELAETLLPRRDSAIEWWFIHGFFQEETGRRYAFMASFFRHRIHSRTSGPVGHSLLLSLLDLETGNNSVSSQVNPELIDYFLRTRSPSGKIDFDPNFIELLFEEVHARGPLRGVRRNDAPVGFTNDPLRISWRDFSLNQNDGDIELGFSTPETGVPIHLQLTPQDAMMTLDIGGPSHKLGLDVFWRSFPRLRLNGSFGEKSVSGEAWLDHQWGDHVLYRSRGSERRLVGWDWFAIHLKDRSNWQVTILRDARSRRAIARNLSIQDPDGSVRHLSGFRIEPRRNWESPRTRIHYPTHWRLVVPELAADLTFTPYREDQEIPVFGFIRAIWEGAGRITGTLSGTEVSGHARGEFQGYGYIFDFDRFLKRAAACVDRRIRKFFPASFTASSFRKELGPEARRRDPAVLTEMIADPVWDLLERGGKRWRSIFTLILMDALGTDPRPFETMVCSLSELTHAGALIVDDIEDSSLLRRGAPCIHRRYGVGPAINAANTVYFLATLPVLDHSHLTDTQKIEIIHLIMGYHTRAHFGQAQDLYFSKNMSPANLEKWLAGPNAALILQMYEDKTAGPVMGLAETAAIIAGSPLPVRSACREFARNLGTAFQIIDDIHDFAQTNNWSKMRGEDLADGKLTYVLIRALEMLDKKPRARLIELLCQRTPRPEGDTLREGISLVRQSGALWLCRDEARKTCRSSWQKLARLVPPSEAKIFVGTLCRRLIEIDPGSETDPDNGNGASNFRKM